MRQEAFERFQAQKGSAVGWKTDCTRVRNKQVDESGCHGSLDQQGSNESTEKRLGLGYVLRGGDSRNYWQVAGWMWVVRERS